MHGGEKLRSVVHRVAIFDKEGTITDIVSQSDVIRCVAACARYIWKSTRVEKQHPDLHVCMLLLGISVFADHFHRLSSCRSIPRALTADGRRT